MRTRKPLLIVLGALLALVGAGFLAAGVGVSWVHVTQRDADGFYTSPTYAVVTEGFAITSEDLHLVARTGDPFGARGQPTLRVRVTPTGPERAVFVGLANDDDVDAFLGGVAHSRITRVGSSSDDVSYRAEPGTATPATPASQDVWVASSEGVGPRTLTVDGVPGDWTLVVMNADGSPGVTVEASAGVKTGVLLPVAIGLLIASLLLLGAATAMLIAGTAGPRRQEPAAEPEAAALTGGGETRPYPVLVEGQLDPQLSRGMWLVKWLLALPHVIVLAFMWTGFAILTVVAGFAILFTGRYPRGIFDFNVGVMRWTWRVTYYAYGVLGTDRYPPFTLAADPAYPATLDVAYPGELSRGLVLIKWWLLAIPHYLIIGIFTGGIISWTYDGGQPEGWQAVGGTGLIGVLVLVAAIVLLFAGRYPNGLYDLVMGLQRWVYRVMAYAALMTDEYPPFRLDAGGSEAPPREPGPPTGPSVEGGGQRELTRA
ncbi:MAG TPA: DUF4389 domain-containing protein [Nitriliruptorales bacterium]|nr:DUF4389 domain-containing protein [Nitriliruptorales bacterium]